MLLASGAALPSVTKADSDPVYYIPDGGGAPAGDPDGPAGPTKRLPPSGRISPAQGNYSVTTAGDGGTGWRVWMWRFHVVLLSLKIRFLG
ncbi:MAG: hypothetical protein HY076_05225 [Candidatus Eisenbacteria bacterium]|uniref:Uncharacterized protein n=1 Tax=Eiseniibacteriota bacterium TaxID=2212470 RepID=A0A9D6LBJ2_UNCEI|nr:hypothetical protein [Candidatus Eisenbacteria bacterium]